MKYKSIIFAITLVVSTSDAFADTSYGSYGTYQVTRIEDKKGNPRNCMLSFGRYDDGRQIAMYPDVDLGVPVLILYNPQWDLTPELSGSITVKSGSFSQRYKIKYVEKSTVEAPINAFAKFSRAFKKNYQMTIETPARNWTFSLDGSFDAYQAWRRCIQDIADSANARKSNPWQDDSRQNPWSQ